MLLQRGIWRSDVSFCYRRPALTIHPPPATVGIQRPQTSRDSATRITLPSHPAIGAQKAQPPHTMAQVCALRCADVKSSVYGVTGGVRVFRFHQKPIFSTGTPVAAATVAPIVATNTVPSTTTIGIDCLYVESVSAGRNK